jgi:hypothetical protein
VTYKKARTRRATIFWKALLGYKSSVVDAVSAHSDITIIVGIIDSPSGFEVREQSPIKETIPDADDHVVFLTWGTTIEAKKTTK